METKFIFLFLSLFLLTICVSVVSANVPPFQTINVPDQYLAYGQTQSLYTNNYFVSSDYDGIDLWYNSSEGILAVDHFRLKGQGSYCTDKELKVCVIPTIDDFQISLTPKGDRAMYNFSMRVYNYTLVCGGVPGCPSPNVSASTLDDFIVYTNRTYEEVNPSTSCTGFIDCWSNSFVNIFPDVKSMSWTKIFAFVLVTFMLINIILVLVFWKVTGNVGGALKYVLMLINIGLFLFFLSIGYIPVSYLMWIIIFVAIIWYVRSKI